MLFVSYLVSWFVSKLVGWLVSWLVGWSVSYFVAGKDRNGFILINRHNVHASREAHPVSSVRGFRIY